MLPRDEPALANLEAPALAFATALALSLAVSITLAVTLAITLAVVRPALLALALVVLKLELVLVTCPLLELRIAEIRLVPQLLTVLQLRALRLLRVGGAYRNGQRQCDEINVFSDVAVHDGFPSRC